MLSTIGVEAGCLKICQRTEWKKGLKRCVLYTIVNIKYKINCTVVLLLGILTE